MGKPGSTAPFAAAFVVRLTLGAIACVMGSACSPRSCVSSLSPNDDASASSDDDSVDDADAAPTSESASDRRARLKRERREKKNRGQAAARAGRDRSPNDDGGEASSSQNDLLDSSSPAVPDDKAKDTYTKGDPNYREDGCEKLADVSSIQNAYVPGQTRPTVEALARVRYPMGLAFLKAQDDAALKTWFVGAPDTFEGAASRFDAAVHEGSHIWGTKHFDIQTVHYPVRDDLTIDTKRLNNFLRSEILTKLSPEAKSDSYAKIYLEGKSGAQGFNTLLDEYNAYAHSLAARYCTRDLVRPGMRVSATDGILTMMYYVETYLELARTAHPADYAAIMADAGHRRLILTVWDRAEFWLRRSVAYPSLSIALERATALAYDPTRLAEITAVREASAKAKAR